MTSIANKIAINQILTAINLCLEVTEDQIRSGRREADKIMNARKMFVAAVFFSDANSSPTEIGKFLKVKNSPHARVYYLKNKHYDHYETDKRYKEDYDEVISVMENEGQFEINKEYKTYLKFLEDKKSEIHSKLVLLASEHKKVIKQIYEHTRQREIKTGT